MNRRIHPACCRCEQCASAHPSGRQIAPSLRASLLAFAAIAAWAAILALADAIVRLVSQQL